MKSNNLFATLKDKEPVKAQVVGKNILVKDPANLENFETYFEFLLSCASKEENKELCEFWLHEAETSLQNFSMDCNINSSLLDKILSFQKKYQSTIDDIYARNKKIVSDNNKCVLGLIRRNYNLMLQNGRTKVILDDIAELDKRLVKEAFTEDDQKSYKEISEGITSIVSTALKKEAKDTNVKALKSFKDCFDMFNDDSKYKKDELLLKSLFTDYLFKYDPKNLDQEVVMYYNYVFNTIFSKVKDDLKYKIVEWSIDNKHK